MGHKSDDTFLAYISRISGVDSQSIMHNLPQREETFDFLRSMGMNRDLAAPMPAGAELTVPRRVPPKQPQDHTALKKARTSEFSAKRALFFDNRHIEAILDDFDEDGSAEEPEECDAPFRLPLRRASKYLEAALRYEPERVKVVENLCRGSTTVSFADAVTPLFEMSTSGNKPTYYPGTCPDSTGRCTLCNKSITR